MTSHRSCSRGRSEPIPVDDGDDTTIVVDQHVAPAEVVVAQHEGYGATSPAPRPPIQGWSRRDRSWSSAASVSEDVVSPSRSVGTSWARRSIRATSDQWLAMACRPPTYGNTA